MQCEAGWPAVFDRPLQPPIDKYDAAPGRERRPSSLVFIKPLHKKRPASVSGQASSRLLVVLQVGRAGRRAIEVCWLPRPPTLGFYGTLICRGLFCLNYCVLSALSSRYPTSNGACRPDVVP